MTQRLRRKHGARGQPLPSSATCISPMRVAGRVLKRSGAAKKATTLAIDRGRIERHIKPLLGTHAIAAVHTERRGAVPTRHR